MWHYLISQLLADHHDTDRLHQVVGAFDAMTLMATLAQHHNLSDTALLLIAAT